MNDEERLSQACHKAYQRGFADGVASTSTSGDDQSYQGPKYYPTLREQTDRLRKGLPPSKFWIGINKDATDGQ